MSSHGAPPNPCLVALLLVCQTRTGAGAQVIFHYPPTPLSTTDLPDASETITDQSGDEISDDSDVWSTDEDYFNSFGRQNASIGSLSDSRGSDRGDEVTGFTEFNSQVRGTVSKSKQEPLLGLGEDGLVALLAPNRAWHKRKFELGINDLTFVSRPVFAKPDGSWKRQKRSKKKETKPEESDTASATEEESNPDPSSDAPQADLREDQQVNKSQLLMFNLVFVMNPPALEHVQRVKDMYNNIIKKFSRALKWEQAHHDYVWEQTELILSSNTMDPTTTQISDLSSSSKVLERSSLAMAIVTIFNAIAASRIALVELSPGVSVSLQIPPVTSTSYLPSLTEPPIQPGLWLTTATEAPSNTVDRDAETTSSTLQVAKSYTLLLKSPPQRITKDAQTAGGSLASHLPKFVAALRPTKSFYKLSNTAHISLADVHLLARHLIFWRRAIAIPPLHQRDTYILSPNADLNKLGEACKSYEAQFPTSLPSLPKLLSVLSGTPRPFGSLIPSPDHKDIYMLILAWLMRNGWVTQLRTFAYVRVDPSIKTVARNKNLETENFSTLEAQPNDPAEDKAQNQPPRDRPSFISRQSSDGKRSIRTMRNDRVATLILNPPRASPEESRWLEHIRDSLLLDDDAFASLSQQDKAEFHQNWPALVKYFNGSVALESIPVLEGLKWKTVWELLIKLGLKFGGSIETEEGINNRILVSVRHW